MEGLKYATEVKCGWVYFCYRLKQKFSFVTIKVGQGGVNPKSFLSLFFMSLLPQGRGVSQRNDQCHSLYCFFFEVFPNKERKYLLCTAWGTKKHEGAQKLRTCIYVHMFFYQNITVNLLTPLLYICQENIWHCSSHV